MARRGRRQVLQLDDVSSSHPPRPRGFAPMPSEEVKRNMTSNPLLSLVGYTSDASTDEDSDSDSRPEKHTPPNSTSAIDSKPAGSGHTDPVLEIPLPAEAEPVKGPEPQERAEPSHRTTESMQKAEPVVVGSMLDIPLPESSDLAPRPERKSVGMESELANFFAEIKEIESISTESGQPDKEDPDVPTTTNTPSTNDPVTTADSSQPPEVDFGFIPRPDASAPLAAEEPKVAPPVVEEKPKSTSASSAYQSMFVKGASEFVKMEKEEEKKENGLEMEEELPEEPVSEWQMVQDEATGYYYYWNMVTGEVTWEIPAGYTQFLLLHKEYQERLAAIPKDRLLRMKERKRQGEGTGRESSPAPSTSKPKKEKKHKRDKHRKEKSEATSSLPAVPIGPQLPPTLAEDSKAEVKSSADQSDAEPAGKTRNTASPKPSSEWGKEGKVCEPLDSAVDSTSISLPQDVEAIFDEALSAMAESHADSSKPDTVIDMFRDDEAVASKTVVPVATSSSVMETSALTPVDVTTSVDSSKSVSAASSMSGSPAPADSDSATAPTAAGAHTSVVSSSSVVSSVALSKKEGRESRGDSGEGVVTNSGVKDSAGQEDEEDDLDMDFDDIDDVDRALEKALEKKLEKRKAELEKLENRSEEDAAMPDSHPLGSSVPSHSDVSDASEPMSDLAQAEADSAVSSSVKSTVVGHSSRVASSSAATEDKDVADSSEMRSKPSRAKRSAAEPSVKEESSIPQEPVVKKARLVAYDAAETDEESVDATEEASATPAQLEKTSGDVNSLADVLPTPPPEPVDNLAEIEEMANTACAKLGFLDVTVDGLTPLQTSLMALQTRMTDWKNGGLNGEYFYQRLKEVNDLLTHYESCAVPPGWTCQWDSNFRRYFYINGSTGETQWEYPEDASKTEERKTRKGKGAKKKRSKVVVGPEPALKHSSKTASSEEREAAAEHPDGSLKNQNGVVAYPDGVEEDLDGVAMVKEEAEVMREESGDNQPSTSTTDSPPDPLTDGGVAAVPPPSALQALFPGEPLPPGTELLLGLPPPPPPPLPPADEATTTTTTSTTTNTTATTGTEDAYVCADDSSDEGGERGKVEEVVGAAADMPNLDPDIDGEEMVEEDEEEGGVGVMDVERKEGGGEEEGEGVAVAAMVVEDPAVISRPPQLRFPPHHPPPPPAAAVASAVACVSSSTSSGLVAGLESSTVSSLPVLSAAPVLNTAGGQPLPDSASSTSVSSPKTEERHRSSRSPAPSHEPSSSSGGDLHKRDKPEKHKKKKKEKLGSHTMSLKKKGVSTMVQNWQKVQKEVEKEERANQQRQMAIRQQLDEWKKGNS
ncbi:uncharacterized protein LOC143287018 [Babylonia areolata]|uniref:uncharacterized protein LOC143287018 n=1 Tax=Babylonia areolata TaxID=304850 RepID=UPI003FD458EB